MWTNEILIFNRIADYLHKIAYKYQLSLHISQ